MNKKRKNNQAKVVVSTIFASLLILILIIGGLMLRLTGVSGSWYTEQDLTEEVVSNVALWLSDVEGSDVTKEWIRDHAGDMKVTVQLDLNRTGLAQGDIDIVVDEQSYEQCQAAGYELASACLKEIIAGRLEMVGYGENISSEEVDKIIVDVLGSSMEEYLRSKGVHLLPEYEALNDRVGMSGTYSLDLKKITIATDGGEAVYRYVKDGDMLILPEASIVYRKQVAHEK